MGSKVNSTGICYYMVLALFVKRKFLLLVLLLATLPVRADEKPDESLDLLVTVIAATEEPAAQADVS